MLVRYPWLYSYQYHTLVQPTYLTTIRMLYRVRVHRTWVSLSLSLARPLAYFMVADPNCGSDETSTIAVFQAGPPIWPPRYTGTKTWTDNA